MGYWDNFNLNSTASIYRRTLVSDGYGGSSYSSTLVASVSCAVWIISASERIQNERVHNATSHRMVCEPSTSFQGDDYAVIGSDTYKMTAPDDILRRGELMQIDLELKG